VQSLQQGAAATADDWLGWKHTGYDVVFGRLQALLGVMLLVLPAGLALYSLFEAGAATTTIKCDL